MAAIGESVWQPGFGHVRRESFTVPATLAAASSSEPTPERMSMAKQRRLRSGRSRATVRVFSPTTQLGASGTRQPQAGHSVSVQ